ncbi:MAG: ATP-binding protein [Candidatus Geothermincolia bacterium]
MSFVVAFAGKGGTGKTTLAGLTVSYLVRTFAKPVLAVDADANSNLDLVLGVKSQKNMGGIREHLTKNITKLPAGMTKEVWVEALMEQALVEEKGFDLISMGRPEGPGCYCYLNNIFRRYLDMMQDGYDYVVVDNEAGMEHLSRRTTRGVDMMFVVSDASFRGVRTVGRIVELTRELELDIKRMALVLSRVPDEVPPSLLDEAAASGLELAAMVPEDAELRRLDIAGTPLTELPDANPARLAVERMLERYLGPGA